MSLLFSVQPPQKSDVSALLHPSLDDLLAVCRRYQVKKSDVVKATRSASESEQQQEKEDSKSKKTEGNDEPVRKRRRTLEGEEPASSKVESSTPDTPGTSKDPESTPGKGEKSPDSSQKQSQKTASIWGSRPPTDWVDSLVKAIQSAITKVPV